MAVNRLFYFIILPLLYIKNLYIKRSPVTKASRIYTFLHWQNDFANFNNLSGRRDNTGQSHIYRIDENRLIYNYNMQKSENLIPPFPFLKKKVYCFTFAYRIEGMYNFGPYHTNASLMTLF